MKSLYTYILIGFLGLISAQSINAQQIGDLNGINFQAVAIDEDGKEIVGMDEQGKPLYESNLEVRFTITTGQDGNVLYQETHETVTDAYGHFGLVIGQGSTTGSGAYDVLLDIPWIEADQWLQVELKYNGNDFRLVSNQQFMSVPYSFYTDDIADDAITTSKILDGEVKNADIGADAVTSDKILDSEVKNADIEADAVTSDKILDGEVVNEDIADATIDLTSKVTNQLGVQNGGTGLDASTVTDGQILVGDGTTNDFQLTNISAGAGIEINNSAGGIEISSPPVGVDSDGSFTIPVGSNGDINAGEAWYSPNSLKLEPSPDKPFAMGDIFLVSANIDLQGCILSAYLQSIDGSGNANVQVVIFNPQNNGNVTLTTPATFKFLLVK